MAGHLIQHGISGNNHTAGTTPVTGNFTVTVTNDSAAIAELTVEAPGAETTTSKIPYRSASGHINVPSSGQTGNQAIGYDQAAQMITDGIYKNSVHSAVSDHTAATVGDGTVGVGGVALAVNDMVINTTDKKVYTVTSIAGGTTGATCTWNSGVSPTTAQMRLNRTTDRWWVYDVEGATWIDKGTTDHVRQHTMTGTSDHTANNWKVWHSNGSGQVVELALGAANAPLLSAGASSAPVFGSCNFASAIITCAGAVPVASDFSTWGNSTAGYAVGTGGAAFAILKNATGSVFVVEMGVVT